MTRGTSRPVELINLTPHPVQLVLVDGSEITIPCSGQVARVEEPEREEVVNTTAGAVRLRRSTAAPVLTDLPAPENGKGFIVARIVAEVARRDDLVVPSRLIRNEDGAVVGAGALRGGPW